MEDNTKEEQKSKLTSNKFYNHEHAESIQRMDQQQSRTLEKKQRFLEAYEKSSGNISIACSKAGIKSRKTFYNWCKTDPDFKKAVDGVMDSQYEFMEDLIKMQILRGHAPSIHWWLSHRHPKYMGKRGQAPPKRKRKVMPDPETTSDQQESGSV